MSVRFVLVAMYMDEQKDQGCADVIADLLKSYKASGSKLCVVSWDLDRGPREPGFRSLLERLDLFYGDDYCEQQTDGYATWQEAKDVALKQPHLETIHVTRRPGTRL